MPRAGSSSGSKLVTARKQVADESKITDYQMIYTVQRGGGTSRDEFFVVVKGGKVQDVLLNHDQRLRPDQFDSQSMRGLFNDIDRFLQMDEMPNAPRTIRQGIFDNSDGHLVYFRRQVLDSSERVEIDVKEFKPTPSN